MSKHNIYDPAATALVGDPAILVGLETGLTSDKLYSGQPFSRLSCLSPSAGGETVTLTVPGTIPGVTPAEVAQRVAALNFVRVRFTGLTCEVRGDSFNKVTYSGTAEKAEVVAAPSPTAGK